MRKKPSSLVRDPYERRRWNRALRMAAEGVRPTVIIRANRLNPSTFYDRMAKLRVLAECFPQPIY